MLLADPQVARVVYADGVLREAARSLWAEPRAPDPPARVWRDWVLVVGLVLGVLLETVLRDDLVWRGLSLLVVLWVPALLYRRTHPLAVVAVIFGSHAAIEVVAIASDVEWEGPGSGAVLLVLPYALLRWGSGREAAIGLAIMSAPVVLSAVSSGVVSDAVGGAVVVSLAAAVGASVRYQRSARLQTIDRVRLREREQLARELHDTVAHHVSAIAIQAQAGRTLAPSNPDAAVDAVEVIEQEASRTLAEMRAIVGALRQGEDPDLAPQRGLAELHRLARGNDPPRVTIDLSGQLDDLRPAVDAALYRLAQESITNAVRHARHATRIDVRVVGDGDRVRLTVTDDGDASSVGADPEAGFGLVGMAERATLLGGTFDAGPDRNRGWTVDVVLPRDSDGAP